MHQLLSYSTAKDLWLFLQFFQGAQLYSVVGDGEKKFI